MFLCPNKRGKNELSIEEFSYLWASPLDRRHLGKTQINLVFRSVCTIFAKENIKIMRTITVNRDENVLRGVNPPPSDKAAIRREYALKKDLSVEELYHLISEEIDAVYAHG